MCLPMLLVDARLLPEAHAQRWRGDIRDLRPGMLPRPKRPDEEKNRRIDLEYALSQRAHPAFKLDIVGPRESSLAFMPVPLRLTLTNNGSETISVNPLLNDTNGGQLAAFVQFQEGPIFKWIKKWETVPDEGQRIMRPLPPGESRRGSLELYWQPEIRVFDKAGYYTVLVYWNNAQGRCSASCVVKVIEPTGSDRESLARVRAAGLETYLPLEGRKPLTGLAPWGRGAKWEQALSGMADVVEAHPDSPYAVCAMTTLLLSFRRGTQTPPQSMKRLGEPLKQRLLALIAERMKHNNDPRVLYGFAEYLMWIDHDLAARYVGKARFMHIDNHCVADHVHALWGIGTSSKSSPPAPVP